MCEIFQILPEKSKQDPQMGNKPMKKMFNNIGHWEMQIRLQLDPILLTERWFNFKKKVNNKRWQRCGEIRILTHCWWECKTVKPFYKTLPAPHSEIQNYHMIQHFHF